MPDTHSDSPQSFRAQGLMTVRLASIIPRAGAVVMSCNDQLVGLAQLAPIKGKRLMYLHVVYFCDTLGHSSMFNHQLILNRTQNKKKENFLA